MNDNRILPFCHKHRIKLPLNWRHCCQTVRYHNKNESRKHFLTKAKVAWELMSRGQTVFSEFQFNKLGFDKVSDRMAFPVADLLWLDELMVIELESNLREDIKKLKFEQFKPFNVFVFDLKKSSVEDILNRIGIK